LAARVGRHLRGGRVRRWHIDYLRPHARPVGLWLAPQARQECAWARRLAAAAYADVVVPRFGASDCDCAAHLFHLGELPPADLTLPPARYRPWTAAP
jgi:Uri superfamily endonuclease